MQLMYDIMLTKYLSLFSEWTVGFLNCTLQSDCDRKRISSCSHQSVKAW